MLGDFWQRGGFTKKCNYSFFREIFDQLPKMCTKINVPKITFLLLEPKIWF